MAAFNQLLYLFRLVQADGDMLLQVEPHLEGAQQALIVVVLIRGEHVQLLVALRDEIHHLLLTSEQRRQRGTRVSVLGQQAIFGFAVLGELSVEQAQRFPQRLLAPYPEPPPVKQPIPQRAERVEQ